MWRIKKPWTLNSVWVNNNSITSRIEHSSKNSIHVVMKNIFQSDTLEAISNNSADKWIMPSRYEENFLIDTKTFEHRTDAVFHHHNEFIARAPTFWSKHFRCFMLIMQNHHDRFVQLSQTLPGDDPRIAQSSLERKLRSAGLPAIKSLTLPQTSWLNLVLLNWPS